MFVKPRNVQRKFRTLLIVLIILLAAITLWLMPLQHVNASEVTVCAEGCDFTSLQAAIDSPAVLPGQEILLRDAVHTEAGIDVNKALTIRGQGAQETILQAHAQPEVSDQRVFLIQRGTSVTIQNMTIRHGNPKTEPESGGGIRNEGTLTLENVIVRDNSGSAGGGILNDGTITLINCTVSHNGSRGGGNFYMECKTGGGLKNMAGEMTLINTTVSDNHAVAKGGGIHVACNGLLVLENSTISNNISENNGGGVFLNGVGEFTHSTISQNEAKTGGGIYIEGSGEAGLIRGQLSFSNTLIAGNIGRREKYGVPDCVVGEYGSLAVNESNWVGDGNCEGAYSGDPMLVVLAEPPESSGDEPRSVAGTHVPQTHMLLPESPIIDLLPSEACLLESDQWGTARPQGAGCEIGAYELPKEKVNSPKTSVALVLSASLLLVVLGLGWLLARMRAE
jgi:hypothetical protein